MNDLERMSVRVNDDINHSDELTDIVTILPRTVVSHDDTADSGDEEDGNDNADIALSAFCHQPTSMINNCKSILHLATQPSNISSSNFNVFHLF